MRKLFARIALALSLLGSTAASAATCAGTSLLPQFQADTPDLWQEVLTDFEKIPNGTGIFWKIEKEGIAPSWLLGTMHVADAEITTLKTPISSAFDGANTLVIESREAVDPDLRMELATRMMEAAQLPEGSAFDADFTAGQKRELGEMTVAHGVPYFAARRMQPWFVSILLSLPPCVALASLRGEPILDEKLFLDGTAAGKEVIGLETADEQMEAIEGLEDSIGTADLLDLVNIGMEGVDNWYATLMDLYQRETVSLLIPLLDKSPQYATMSNALEEAEAQLIVGRNKRMRDRLLPILQNGGVFVGVGALHLSGDTGLVALLRENGYEVTRVE